MSKEDEGYLNAVKLYEVLLSGILYMKTEGFSEAFHK